MSNLKYIIFSAIIGAILGFSFWPVVSGVDVSKNCNEMILFDCILPEVKTPRIVYIIRGQHFDYPYFGFSSRDEYCKISNTCRPETIEIPMSLIAGAGAGALIGYVISLMLIKKRSN